MRLPLLAALLCLLLPVAGPVAAAGHSETGPAPAPGPSSVAPPADELRPASSPATATTEGPPLATSPGTEALAVAQSDDGIDPSNTTMAVQLRANGDARVTVTTTYVLRDDNDSRAFDRLAGQFRSGTADTGYNITVFESAAERSAPDREMAIRNDTYESETGPRGNVTIGRLSMSFTWTNFSQVDGDRLIVGDAFNTSDGNATWLPGLAADQRLVVVGPEEYGALDSPPDAGVQEGRKFTWEGPTEFEPGYLHVVYQRTTDTPSPSPTPGGPLLGWFLMSAGLLGGGMLAVVAYLWTRRETGGGSPTGGPSDGDEPPATPATAGAAATNGEEADGDDEPPPADVDLDLLSDEERVEYLLQQNGGRMKQADIVKETGWSNAKVSQLLSGMADDDRVNKLRIGRENLISLPDEDVAEFDEQ